MAITDLAIYGLLGSGLVFAIVELGLSAYAVSVTRGTYSVPSYYDVDGTIQYETIHISPPAQFSLLLFCSLWTIVVVGALAVLQLFVWRGRRHDSGKIPSILTIVINALTMIFWLAGFAALADVYRGVAVAGIAAALLAFAILCWLVFLALLVLNILTAVSVARTGTHGYGPFTTRTTHAGATTTNTPAAAPAPATTTAPPTAPTYEPKVETAAHPDAAATAPEAVTVKNEPTTTV